MSGPGSRSAARPRRRSRLGRLVRWALLVATLVVAGSFLAPKVQDAVRTLPALRRVNALWLAAALAAEIGSLLAFSLVTWVLITRRRPPFGRVVRIDLVTIALSHAVPAGSAAGTALGYELLEAEGIGAVPAGFVKVSQSLLSGVLLQLLLGLALAMKIVIYGPSPATIGLAAGGSVLVFLVLCFGWLLGRRTAVIRRLAVGMLGWVPRLSRGRIAAVVDELGEHTRALLAAPRRLLVVCLWSMANWVFDLLALWAALRAFGTPTNPVLLTVAFCIAQVAAALPISPAGLGVVEGSLVPLLTSFGTPAAVAVLGVLGWRLVNYWLPLPLGAAAYLGILLDGRTGRRNGAGAGLGQVPT
jgi:uncharacterized protein (TIRG00374 family)